MDEPVNILVSVSPCAPNLAEKNGRSSGTAYGGGADLKGGVPPGNISGRLSGACQGAGQEDQTLLSSDAASDVPSSPEPRLLPAGSGPARTALQEQPSKLERPDCNGGNESTRGGKHTSFLFVFVRTRHCRTPATQNSHE